MNVFVSYSRADNSPERLLEIELILAPLGTVYIDDLHYPPNADRYTAVHAALAAADLFLAVISNNYLHTPWTRYEFIRALRRGIPLLALTKTDAVGKEKDGRLMAHATSALCLSGSPYTASTWLRHRSPAGRNI